MSELVEVKQGEIEEEIEGEIEVEIDGGIKKEPKVKTPYRRERKYQVEANAWAELKELEK